MKSELLKDQDKVGRLTTAPEPAFTRRGRHSLRSRTCLVALVSCVMTGGVRSADSSLPPVIHYNEAPSDALRADEQLTLLHEWPGTLVFGFVGQERPLVYDSTRQVFEVHDLAAPDVPARGWKNPDADTVISGAFSPDRRTLATVHSAGNRDSRVQARQSRIQLWNIETGEPIERSFTPSDAGYVAFSPDGKSLFGAALDSSGKVTVWDVASGEIRQVLSLPPPQPHFSYSGVHFSPTGQYLAARISFGGAFSVWEAKTWKPAVESSQPVIGLAVSPDGQRLMTYGLPPGRSPGEIQFWDVAARRPLGLPHPVPGIFWDYQFDPDSRHLVVSFLPGDDRIHAKVWRLPAEDAPPSAPPPTPNADSIDVRDVGFKTPQCVVWDRTADVYLVSNIHGHPLDKDDNGFISRVRPDGTVEALKWIDGASEGVTLHAPKGMALTRDSLWVTDIDVVRRFDRLTGKSLAEVTVEGASYLNDVVSTSTPDFDGGGLFVTDTGQERDGVSGLKSNGKPRLVIIDLAAGKVTTQSMRELRTLFSHFKDAPRGAFPEVGSFPQLARRQLARRQLGGEVRVRTRQWARHRTGEQHPGSRGTWLRRETQPGAGPALFG
jgi:WD40 repeat protein